MSQSSPSRPNSDSIPFPHLTSWMHERIPLPPLEEPDAAQTRYLQQRPDVQLEDRIFNVIYKLTRLGKRSSRWVKYKFAMVVVRNVFKLTNRLEIRGKENIPAKGGIFIMNHRGDLDVLLFLVSFGRPVGVFTDVGDSWVADAFERLLGFVPRRGTAPIMVEKMIRMLAQRNRYFGMWPEGTPSRTGEVMQGFSSIVKVYAVLNAKKDVVPFVPVLMQGMEAYSHHRVNRFQKITVEFLKPVFVPRSWLNPPEEGGKTPREIIDALMLILARKLGQAKLVINPRLESRRTEPGTPWHS
ncbi:MAG TPA: 1-acyl-sn-glycerol-3-phosphate acyltransferase [Candidatus Lokiarchaeia archaeon]|nr:1-acyl-sn-glycerol-3-phosphate acyltransferase [Candidatus Lokiarchaeia archaeon]